MEQLEDNVIVFLDIALGNIKAGRIVIELFKNLAPKSVENFRCLCTGEKSKVVDGKSKPLHLKGTKFHKVISQCFVLGGDLAKNNSTSNETIYDDLVPREKVHLMHDKPGLLGMCVNESNTITSQFYITTVECPQLDDQNMIFGRVIKGLNIVVEMSDVPRKNDLPLEDIVITNCGELTKSEPWNLQENECKEDIYPPWPNDLEEHNSTNKKELEKAILKIKLAGNNLYKKNQFALSERKYIKSLRYLDWYAKVDDFSSSFFRENKTNSLLNLAAVKLKRKEFKEVMNLCNQVLKIDPNNGKSYYRRAQAKLGLREIDKALADLYTASNLVPNDKSIQSVLSIAKRDKLSYLKKERLFFSRVFKLDTN